MSSIEVARALDPQRTDLHDSPTLCAKLLSELFLLTLVWMVAALPTFAFFVLNVDASDLEMEMSVNCLPKYGATSQWHTTASHLDLSLDSMAL